jgi:YD repeat-containing protein
MTDGITTTVFYNGYLTSMTDSFGNAVYFVYNGKSYSASSTTWKPAASGNQLTSIVQVNAADNKAQTLVTLTYGSNNYLTKITDKAGNITEYTYTSSKLTKVTHADSSTVSYTYSGNYLTSATDNTSGYGVAYTWETLGFRKIVNDIKEYTNSNGSKTYGAEIKVDGSDLQHTVYTYNGSDRTFDTSDDQISTYTFDYAGRTVNVCTKNPNGTILGVETGSYGNKSATNSLTSSASLGQQAANDVLNGGAEVTDSGSTLDISGWNIGTVSNGSVKANTTESHHGDRSFALANTKNSSASAQAYASRTLRTDTFTLSAYIKTTDITSFGTNGGASIQFCTDEAGTNVVAESELVNYKTSSTTDNGWVRVSCTYTPTVKQKYYFFLRLKNVTVKPPHEKHRRPTLL